LIFKKQQNGKMTHHPIQKGNTPTAKQMPLSTTNHGGDQQGRRTLKVTTT